jgi:hypothetical protein
VTFAQTVPLPLTGELPSPAAAELLDAARVVEATTRERPMRVVHPTDHSYDGPAPRGLPAT